MVDSIHCVGHNDKHKKSPSQLFYFLCESRKEGFEVRAGMDDEIWLRPLPGSNLGAPATGGIATLPPAYSWHPSRMTYGEHDETLSVFDAGSKATDGLCRSGRRVANRDRRVACATRLRDWLV